MTVNRKFAEELTNLVDGNTWFSSNFTIIINEVSADTAVKKLKGFPNSIVEIVYHMTQWKIFCIKKIQGDASFDIAMNTEEDWKRFNGLAEGEWEDIKNDYAKATNDLADLIGAFPDNRLNDIVPGRDYPFFHLFVGVIQHETAHMTQINYLQRLLVV
jgi:hypothetical protein